MSAPVLALASIAAAAVEVVAPMSGLARSAAAEVAAALHFTLAPLAEAALRVVVVAALRVAAAVPRVVAAAADAGSDRRVASPTNV